MDHEGKNYCLNMCYQAVMTNLLAQKCVQFPQTEEFYGFVHQFLRRMFLAATIFLRHAQQEVCSCFVIIDFSSFEKRLLVVKRSETLPNSQFEGQNNITTSY